MNRFALVDGLTAQQNAETLGGVAQAPSDSLDHWDRIVIRSWMTVGGKKELYQEDALASILDVAGILDAMPAEDPLPDEGLVLFSGTVASKIGLVYGERFDFEMEDPILKRKNAHGYTVKVHSQHI